MDIPNISIDSSQSSLMTAVNTKLLSMSLDTLKQNGEQMNEMLEEAGAQVMNASHIDLLT